MWTRSELRELRRRIDALIVTLPLDQPRGKPGVDLSKAKAYVDSKLGFVKEGGLTIERVTLEQHIDEWDRDSVVGRSGDPKRDEFSLLSLKWTRQEDPLTWWGPDNSGYTKNLDCAGRYTAKQIEDDPTYYDDGKDTKAIPCHLVDPRVIRVVPSSSNNMVAFGAEFLPKVKPWPCWPTAIGRREKGGKP